ncbi:hypothetical protein BDV96DRAFT_639289 [Lophiotrema nucula]|uniref:BRCT domain-containing protein n=1 Tax=Lophiotrema nucula TaxID=690887 RepID=A0A6A5ZWR6_9PLEO|nr:hypothetical protein BDV96DRAFT_639289 [Lophiotrema nucula]
MPWSLVEKKSATCLKLLAEQNYNISTPGDPNNAVLVITSEDDVKPDTKGRLSKATSNKPYYIFSQLTKILGVLPAGVKLEAVNVDLVIQDVAKPSARYYRLLKRREGRSEIIFLREGDMIRLDSFCIRLESDPAEVQVNSSGTGEAGAEVPESDDQPIHEAVSKDEPHEAMEETDDDDDDDEDLDRTPTNGTSQSRHIRPRITPDPSIPRTEIVQETPAINRTFQVPEADMGTYVPKTNLVENTPPPASDLAPSGPEMFSTAPMKSELDEVMKDVIRDSGHASSNDLDDTKTTLHMADGTLTASNREFDEGTKKIPQVRMSKNKPPSKRPSEADEEDEREQEPSPRPAKRAKTGKTNVVAVPTPKRKTRGSTPAEPTSAAVESQASAKDDALYSGPKPRVAFSNSEIYDGSQFLKFLTKHGGKKVQSVKGDECNVLCVRDGPLKKSMKLLLCIALGIPIVTDEWLKHSAKQGKLLALEFYMPSVPDQEKEWNTSLDEVLGNKQDTLFNGYTIYFTPTLKKAYHPFSEAEDVCRAAGAVKAASKITKDLNLENTIVLASDEDDDAVALAENGFSCYTKDLLTLSILRGKLDLDSEDFKIIPRNSQPKKKGRPRKS